MTLKKLNNRQQMFVKQFPLNNWNISKTCKDVGIDRASYYLWINNSPAFKKAIEEEKESIIDQYEEDLKKQSEAMLTTATIFALKTLGKDRGYGEDANKINLDLQNIQIEIVKKDAPTN